MIRALSTSIAVAGAVLLTDAGLAFANPADAIKIVQQVWKKGGSNTIGISDITLSNDNAFAVKDIKIRCVFTAKSTGKVTEIQQTIGGPLQPKAQHTFKKVHFGFIDTQANEGTCEVSDATQTQVQKSPSFLRRALQGNF